MSPAKRTAILVVHGMGSQRPLDTVRGIINAVWFDRDDHVNGNKKLWSHPEPSGVDIDLTVMTTNEIPQTTDRRAADFHELYWAHHMSETKALAVLLWLFELGRRGPYFKTGMNGLWWAGAVFLNFLLLSVAFLFLRALLFLSNASNAFDVVTVVLGMTFVALVAGLVASFWAGYRRLSLYLMIAVALVFAGAASFRVACPPNLPCVFGEVDINVIFQLAATPVIGLVVSVLLMGKWGVRAFGIACAVSVVFFVVFVSYRDEWSDISNVIRVRGDVPWSLKNDWTVIIAITIIGLYLVLNALFLQPYLGDAARYFRNAPSNVAVRRAIRKDAVDMLDQLQRSGQYDRIIVAAHSLGTAVAYDMLRAYYSRICEQIPVAAIEAMSEFKTVDDGSPDSEVMRASGRSLIRALAANSKTLAAAAGRIPGGKAAGEVDVWLVTDFVTLGSPLTHAHYLMVNEDDGEKIEEYFKNRVRERDLVLCPPAHQDQDGLISYVYGGKRHLHHGGLFGLTRWTNLYFPVIDIFWGDAIGGPVGPVFGFGVKDVEVWTTKNKTTDSFKHTAYWKTDCPEGRDAPHIEALRKAVNLADA